MIDKRGPRTSAKALIQKDEKYLVNSHKDNKGIWYMLPGGGQHHGEELHQTVIRECQEEIHATVSVVGLRFIREFIAPKDCTETAIAGLHQVEFIFECTLDDSEYRAEIGREPDINQFGVEWLSLNQLRECRFYPSELVAHLPAKSEKTVYLGAID